MIMCPRGVTVGTLDSESSDRGSNPREGLIRTKETDCVTDGMRGVDENTCVLYWKMSDMMEFWSLKVLKFSACKAEIMRTKKQTEEEMKKEKMPQQGERDTERE